MKTSKSFLLTSVCLCAALSASATTWTYTPGTDANNVVGTITDGQWTLKVTEFDKENHVLSFAMSESWGHPVVKAYEPSSDPTKKGVLDLSSPLEIVEGESESQTSTTITKVKIGTWSFGCENEDNVATNMVEFYCNVIDKISGEFNFASDPNLKKVEIGGTAESIGHLVFANDPALKTVKMDFPDMRSVGASWCLFGANGEGTTLDSLDVMAVLNPLVTNICNNALARSFIVGDLVLSNAMNIGEQAFNQASLSSVFLGGGYLN